MVDVVNGKTRVRAWPRKRGKPKTPEHQDQVDKFSQTQRSWRFADPQNALDIMNAREGTPLLPRDIWTAIVYSRIAHIVQSNGKVLWPMAARIDVSNALDAISQTPGSMLVRGEQGWEEATPVGARGWNLIAGTNITSPIADWESPDISAYAETMLIVNQVTTSLSGQRAFIVRNGMTGQWLQGANTYSYLDVNGVRTASTAVFPHATGATAARSFIAQVYRLPSPYGFATSTDLRARQYIANLGCDPIDRIKVQNNNAGVPVGNMTGGQIYLFGR